MNLFTIPSSPDFTELPLNYPLSDWPGRTDRIVDLLRGLSRHPVIFVEQAGISYAIKELPGELALVEFQLLSEMNRQRLPVVQPIGYVQPDQGNRSLLITRYLEGSIPYRSLFASGSLMRYREHLLDAISGLMVQIHLAGVYWGDCSLSNVLFRRDAGALQAYMVDAETAEIYPGRYPPAQRFHDLQIMEENIDGDLIDLQVAGLLAKAIPITETGAHIRLRYQELWQEITREEVVQPGESYRIQERIRALNRLGFSVKDVELVEAGQGDQVNFRIQVAGRQFHHDQLQTLTGIEAQENQARQMMNEIQETKATLTRQQNRSLSLHAAAFHWLENIYSPVAARLQGIDPSVDNLPELYCQVLEHKWFLSEQAQRNVGHQSAVDDYILRFGHPEITTG